MNNHCPIEEEEEEHSPISLTISCWSMNTFRNPSAGVSNPSDKKVIIQRLRSTSIVAHFVFLQLNASLVVIP